MDLFNLYYNSDIQLDVDAIRDILGECETSKKVLVFGMGYDTRLWWEAADAFFVENDNAYIKLNSFVPDDHVIYYNYPNITVKDSIFWLQNDTKTWVDIECPKKLLEKGPYDIIIIDGPPGYRDDLPGRLLPVYWSTTCLSKEGTLVYMDDCNRTLETLCIQKLAGSLCLLKTFDKRDVCKKFKVNQLKCKVCVV